MQDSKLRSFLKTISHRFFATSVTIIIAYVVTGDFVSSSIIGGSEVIAKLVVYYLHERMWARIGVKKTAS